ncbi:HET-domain-containing protein [Heliocybe sulcata]|uniref:HET-domain-containing protein n=1 Tax=Heliocybe sulcata TaxID=5364 RepID=A0A5C3MTV0_9AGAM|nr:HET-domain-containing protein [Heliocybe sulcata]
MVSTDVSSDLQSLVCEACWNTIFSTAGWQAVLAAKEVPGRSGFSKGFSYKTTWSAIQTSCANGCNWCRLLKPPEVDSGQDGEVEVWAACDEDSDHTPAGDKKLRLVVDSSRSAYRPFYATSRTTAGAQIGTVSGYGSHQQFYMYTRPGKWHDDAARFVAARQRITNVSSQESYQLALQCLDHCIHTHHANCPPPQVDIVLPDRVIDCSDVKRPRIVLTGGAQRGFYVTLSYVWGGPQPLTTTENIDDYVNSGLDMSKFPQTIQDAVVVTHNIGQRYLWIDALCILQDSSEDKQRQLGRMQYIYRNAYLCINAACAYSSREGFLGRPRPQKHFEGRIPYRCPDGTVGSVWIANGQDWVPGAAHSYGDELDPVTYRGWCLQEKMLPARSLVYASDTLKFHCQTETVNIGNALCEPSTGLRLPNAIYQPVGPGGTPLSGPEQVTYRQAWLAVIFMYTLREISVPSDKLVALAGVAEQFHLVYRDKYLAGLWQKTLLLDLLWSRSTTDKRPRPKRYRAPSWSWASIDGLVSAVYLEGELGIAPSSSQPSSSGSARMQIRQVEILDCQVTLSSKEVAFGEVNAGTLKLKGYKEKAVLDSGKVLIELRPPLHGPVEIGLIIEDADEELRGQVFVIPLVWDPLGSYCIGLVAIYAGEEQSEYRRVGRFENSTGSKDTEWLKGLTEQDIVLV